MAMTCSGGPEHSSRPYKSQLAVIAAGQRNTIASDHTSSHFSRHDMKPSVNPKRDTWTGSSELLLF
jgi:hypothetical protein